MPRTALKLAALAWLAAALPSAAGAALDAHLDSSRVPASCRACHEGHGVSGSPMLPAPQAEVCLSCHGSEAGVNRLAGEGILSGLARPQLLSTVLAQPFSHPLTPGAFSRHQPDVVTCTSCHSPHRSARRSVESQEAIGSRKLSPRNPNRFEYELCESCHGSAGVTTQSYLDLSRLLNPNNRSFHPVEGPAVERSPSLRAGLAGREISCTDCHGNSDPNGPRGPHGSNVRYLLKEPYETADGGGESAERYALCYSCHERQRILQMSPFPLHALHVTEVGASCATCHSAHGSPGNRALIGFGEETFIAGVGPSSSTGRLGFVSTSAGSGACFLSCHGVDHAPATYGAADPTLTSEPIGALLLPGADERLPQLPGAPPPDLPKRPDKPPPPPQP